MYIQTGERLMRGNSQMGGGTMLGRVPAPERALGTPVTEEIPVLHLTQIQRNKYIGAFTRKPSGFEALFCDDLPSPQVAIAITGKLMIEKNGVRRPVTAVDLKKWQPKDVVNRVYTGRGVSASTNPVSKIKLDGGFTTQSTIVVDPGTRRLHVQVTLDFKGGRDVTADAVFQRTDLDCFLELIDSYESKRPIGRVTGACQIAFSHLEFLSSVRKMFQPAPGSPLTGMFDSFLHRNRKICLLAAVDSPQGKYIRSFETMTIGSDKIDMGHVLVGIEAQRRQKPDSILPFVTSGETTQALMTWAGDLGSALEPYAEAIAAGRRVDLKTYLNDKAGPADLLGDIDGINIGAVYDETKSLAENLRKYYGTKPFRRFHDYLARLTDDSGKPILTLSKQKPPKIDLNSWNRVIHFIDMFVAGVVVKRKVRDKQTPAQQALFDPIVRRGSKEMNIVADYFCNFIEAGLAQEP